MDTKPRKHIVKAQVRSVRRLDNGWFTLCADAPEIARAARPGQFVQVRAGESADPLLNRPFSLAGASREGQIDLLIRAVGRGTRLLAQAQAGDRLTVIGPLGQGFPEIGGRVWTVAGGTGLAPFLFLSHAAGGRAAQITNFYGACSAADCRFLELPPFKFPAGQAPPVITTEDGGLGEKGLVTAALESRLRDCPDELRPDAIFTCGPMAMMNRVQALAAAHGMACFASLEAFMGCGFGACMGCVVPGKDRPYYHVCEDGPVFPAERIDWERIGNPGNNNV